MPAWPCKRSEAGKHVYGEKPFALSVQEAQAVTAAANECGVQLGNAPDTFLGAGLQTARRLIEEGRIGTPISAKATFGYPGPDAWHPSPEFLFQEGGGPLLDMGPYYLTALVQMLGPVKTVSGFSSRAQGKRTIGSGPRGGETFDVTVDTQVLALLEFASGPIAAATFSFDAPTAFRELEVQGTEAVIRPPDPNYFAGSVFLCKKDVSKLKPGEWFEVPAETDWVEIPAGRQRRRSRYGRSGYGPGPALWRKAKGGRRSSDPRAGRHGVHRGFRGIETHHLRFHHLHLGRPAAHGLEPTSEVDLSTDLVQGPVRGSGWKLLPVHNLCIQVLASQTRLPRPLYPPRCKKSDEYPKPR